MIKFRNVNTVCIMHLIISVIEYKVKWTTRLAIRIFLEHIKVYNNTNLIKYENIADRAFIIISL